MLKQKAVRRLKGALRDFPRPGRTGSAKRNGYSEIELRQFKISVLALRSEVLEEIRVEKAAAAASGDATHQHLLSRQIQFLRHLDGALLRIEQSDYGRCVTCGGLIDTGRLMAVPHTQQCISCKKGGKLPGSPIHRRRYP